MNWSTSLVLSYSVPPILKLQARPCLERSPRYYWRSNRSDGPLKVSAKRRVVSYPFLAFSCTEVAIYIGIQK